MKEYKLLEQYSTDITEENKDCKKFLQEKTKKIDPLLDKLQKQNDKLISENEKLKKEVQEIKGSLVSLQSENSKLEKELKKDEELKLLIKLNQEYSHDTKVSVDEITKQATNTIKMFYNNMNNDEVGSQTNKSSLNRSNSSNILKEKKNDLKKSEAVDIDDLFPHNDLESLMKGNKLPVIISEGANRNTNLNSNTNLISEK